ncbi:MAG: hypothetical protein MUC62_08395, partial [Candidatus Thermoplasmatota archaeon]|nr:hypothetical protein [Candidatus Thermoplasmatota archaeon]
TLVLNHTMRYANIFLKNDLIILKYIFHYLCDSLPLELFLPSTPTTSSIEVPSPSSISFDLTSI